MEKGTTRERERNKGRIRESKSRGSMEVVG